MNKRMRPGTNPTYDRLCSAPWTIDQIDPSEMTNFVRVGARFRVNEFGGKYYFEALEGFHPDFHALSSLRADKLSKHTNEHPPVKAQTTPEDDVLLSTTLVPKFKKELWIVLTRDAWNIGISIGFSEKHHSKYRTHGGAHGTNG